MSGRLEAFDFCGFFSGIVPAEAICDSRSSLKSISAEKLAVTGAEIQGVMRKRPMSKLTKRFLFFIALLLYPGTSRGQTYSLRKFPWRIARNE